MQYIKIPIIGVILLIASPFTCACDQDESFVVRLILTDYENNQRYCAGSYITEKFLLTAAHCVNNTKEILIVHGDEGQSRALTLDSGASVIHEKFSENKETRKLDNDIALIHLNDYQVAQIKRNIVLRTISVSYDYEIREKTEFYVLGWGTSDPKNAFNDKLEKKNVRKKNCEEEISDESTICSYKDKVYQGDSGGPLIVDDKQIGIVSGGVEESILYTFLPYYKSWIEKYVQGPGTDKNSSTGNGILAVALAIILSIIYVNYF